MAKKMRLDAGVLQASKADRSVSGLLVPYNQEGKTNLGRLKIRKGALKVPRDTTGITLNVDHKRNMPVGALVAAKETEKGLYGRFRFSNSPAGRKAWNDYLTGKRRHLSVEADIKKIVRGVAVAGQVFAAALVSKPAFESATLLAAEYDEEEEQLLEDIAEVEGDGEEIIEEFHDESEYTDENGVTYESEIDSVTVSDGETTETTTTIVESITDPDQELEEEEEEPILAATIPGALRRTAGSKPPQRTARHGMSLKQLYAKLAEYNFSRDRNVLKEIMHEGTGSGQLFAALTDVKATTGQSGSRPSIASTISLPQWLGELWSGRRYERRYIPLFDSGELTNFEVKAYKFSQKPEVDEWTGNKTNVPSGPVGFDPYTTSATGWAGAHDIDRRMKDFNFPEFWESYFQAMTDSYSEKSDAAALATVKTAAVAVERGNVPTDIDPGIVSIVDGALAILDTALPTFAIVSKQIWRGILLTPRDKVLEYLSTSLSLEEGSLDGFKIVPARGSDLGADEVLVGNKHAAQVLELPGSPIRVEGLDMVKGGIDPGVFGYAATVIHEENALALVTPDGEPGEEEEEEPEQG